MDQNQGPQKMNDKFHQNKIKVVPWSSLFSDFKGP